MFFDQAGLDARIAQAEQTVAARDRRVRHRAGQLAASFDRHLRRWRGPGLVGAAMALLIAWRLPGHRRAGAAGPVAGTPDPARALPWAALVPILWPLLPPPLRRRMNVATATMVAGLVAPVLARLLPARAPVQTMASVDLARYAGRWYEIARLPAPFERACAGDATATYTPRGASIDVDLRCRSPAGREHRTVGEAYPVEGSGDARLEISLFPRWLRWLPLAWSGHWIIAVDPGYATAVVGTPNRRGLWLLARTPQIDTATYERMVAQAAAQRYDVARLKRIEQSSRALPRSPP